MEELSPEKNIGNEDKRKMLLNMLGLPETATDEEMTALLNREHKEFNLGDFKKEGGPVKKDGEEAELSGLPKTTLYNPEINAFAKSNYRSKFPEVRPEHSPAQVRGVDDLRIGKKYILHRPDSTGDVIVEAPPIQRGTGYWVKLRRGGNHPYTDVLSCQDLGVTPYTETDGAKTWNAETWMEEASDQS